MIHFTAYAEEKFAILNNHGVFIRKEEVVNAVNDPDEKSRMGKYVAARKGHVKVIYQREDNVQKIITFYPV